MIDRFMELALSADWISVSMWCVNERVFYSSFININKESKIVFGKSWNEVSKTIICAGTIYTQWWNGIHFFLKFSVCFCTITVLTCIRCENGLNVFFCRNILCFLYRNDWNYIQYLNATLTFKFLQFFCPGDVRFKNRILLVFSPSKFDIRMRNISLHQKTILA